MPHIKGFIGILIAFFCLLAVANQSESNMDSKKTLVISYAYPQEKIIKESSIKLNQTSDYLSHGKGHFSVLLLGEKQDIMIPGIQESFLYFDNNFKSVKLYFEPTNYWLTLSKLIEHINQIKETLTPIKNQSLNSYEFDLNNLTTKHFENEQAEVISKYELVHYKVFFIAKKLNTPKEIHPREHELFQLILRIESKSK